MLTVFTKSHNQTTQSTGKQACGQSFSQFSTRKQGKKVGRKGLMTFNHQ
jgi:hypothetical protein